MSEKDILYEEVIRQSQANVKALGEKLIELDNLYQEIKALKKAAEGIPEVFNKKYQEIVKLAEDYTNTLGIVTTKYLEGNNKLFSNNLQDLSTSNVELKKQIERLEKIDLEKHFDKLQKTLAEIFGAINAINLTLTNIVQTLTGIVQSLGTIQITLDTNHKELKSFIKTTEDHLTDQDKQATKNAELLESKIKSLSEQNELQKKEIKTNRIIQIVGFMIVTIILIYMIFKL